LTKIGSICEENSTLVKIGQNFWAFVKKIWFWLKSDKNLENLWRNFDFG